MQRRRGGLRKALIPAFAAILAGTGCGQDRPQSITVVSWGGSYGRAVEEAAIIPFTEATGVPVNLEAYNGGLAEIRAQVDLGNIHWDVVSLEIADAVKRVRRRAAGADRHRRIASRWHDGDARRPRRLRRRDPDRVRRPLPVRVHGDRLQRGLPSAPGKALWMHGRLLRSGEVSGPARDAAPCAGEPGVCAARCDGVPRDQVYPTLGTPEGLERAFRKLDTIKDQVVWWEAGAQPPQMLADGEVVMSTAYNGRASSTRRSWRASRVVGSSGMASCSPSVRSGCLRRRPRPTPR